MDGEASSRLLLRSLVEVTRAFEDRVLSGLDIDGVRPAHLGVFRYLRPDGSRIGDLATSAGMSGQAMGELVGKMRELGFVDVVADPADRRARLVVLTPRGRDAMATYAARVREVEEQLAGQIGADGVADLRSLLARCADALGVAR
ncbi:MarR family winged helix-turn-helix transcriptional regulator [Gordonia sp. PKS22-38]|uniref:MarR family winged helix-turn-helix transcriptional regulator n=1 Tax=Gordonia prachuapensis TaxID=3115651 RepID=A0ABU7MSH1_9ACTN|nr:MarR family winged helix-turn-helix transcriptional regulator [Gordonia sp. PKS22-38]